MIFLFAFLVCFLLIVMYFFSIAFVKHKMGDFDNIDSIDNKPLWEFKEEIREGIDFIKSAEHVWVYTQSDDNLKLAARYYKNNDSKNTIILFHGYRSTAARDFSCAVQMYYTFGFNVLLVDQRAHGKSEGKLITFGVKESKDVLNWIDFVEKKFSPNNIVLGGMSMGATTVLLSCGYELPKKVKCVIADCGFNSPEEIIKKVAKQAFKINATVFIPILDIFCKLFGKFSIKNSNTEIALKKSDIPVLLIHGKNDNFVPFEMSEKSFASCNKNSKLILVDNADHGLSFLVDKHTVLSEINKFLLENL